jgi:4-amino-4-deoxy-L-arabinose transferase-like glycosyltransferase
VHVHTRETSAVKVWRHQPWRFRIGLVVILLVAATLMVWNLAKGGDAAFYEASARSMSESWHAMLFGAFDPAATVTLDKLSGFAVPQALSIRLFGMSTSSLALPQVLEGLVLIWCMSLIGLRWAGPGTGLVAAAAAASTPIFVSMFAHPMEDGLLTMSLTVAFLFWQRAILTARWWPLLLSGLFVGIGFQAKMMQAWFILPALFLGTWLWDRAPGWRRLSRAVFVSATGVAASLIWVTAIQLTPSSDRPFVDGSTDNNAFAMVFGYNGIDRLVPHAVPGAVGGLSAAHGAHAATASAFVMASIDVGDPGKSLTKLIDPMYVTQVGWLYPVALAAIVFGLVRWWPIRRRRPSVSVVMLGIVTVWLIVAAAVLSVANVPHTAYVAAIGTQLALLAAMGWYESARLLRVGRRPARLAVAAVVCLQACWSIFLAIEGKLPTVILWPLIVISSLGVAVVVVFAWRGRLGGLSKAEAPRAFTRRGAAFAAVVPVMVGVVLLAGPATFSGQVVDPARDGSGGDAYVGLRSIQGSEAGDDSFHPSVPQIWGGSPELSAPMAQLVAAAKNAGGGQNGSPDFVTDSWAVASQIIDATGDSVLTDGGYSGSVQVFTESDLKKMISTDQEHLFAVRGDPPVSDPVRQLVADDSCTSLGSWAAGQSKPPTSSSHDGARLPTGTPHEGDQANGAQANSVTLWQCS